MNILFCKALFLIGRAQQVPPPHMLFHNIQSGSVEICLVSHYSSKSPPSFQTHYTTAHLQHSTTDLDLFKSGEKSLMRTLFS